MKKSKLKTVCALFLAGVLGATGLVGCNSNDDNGDEAKGNEELIYNSTNNKFILQILIRGFLQCL